MTTLPRGLFKALMARVPNEYHLVVFDPGGTIGWAHFIIDCRAFSRPEHKVLRWLKTWDCGEFTGQEHDQIKEAVALINRAHFGPMPFNSRTDVLSEDFALAQLIGGKELVSPIRINAVLAWECKRQGLEFELQDRSQRTQITPERLELFGFEPPGKHKRKWSPHGPGKDAFAAMQHGVVKLRRIKEQSRSRPWKLSDRTSSNALWDCACERGKRCDLTHPR
jgi:hypothetical protein